MPMLRWRGGTSTPRSGAETMVPPMRDRAGARMLEPGDAAQRRRLAAAGGAEQHDDLAGGDVEAHIVDGRPCRSRRPCAAAATRNSADMLAISTSAAPLGSLAIAVGLVPFLHPFGVELLVLLEIRAPTP